MLSASVEGRAPLCLDLPLSALGHSLRGESRENSLGLSSSPALRSSLGTVMRCALGSPRARLRIGRFRSPIADFGDPVEAFRRLIVGHVRVNRSRPSPREARDMGIKSLTMAVVLLLAGCAISSEEEHASQPVPSEGTGENTKGNEVPPSMLNGCSAHSDCLLPYNSQVVNCSTSQSGATCAGYSDRAVCGSNIVYCTLPNPGMGGCVYDSVFYAHGQYYRDTYCTSKYEDGYCAGGPRAGNGCISTGQCRSLCQNGVWL